MEGNINDMIKNPDLTPEAVDPSDPGIAAQETEPVQEASGPDEISQQESPSETPGPAEAVIEEIPVETEPAPELTPVSGQTEAEPPSEPEKEEPVKNEAEDLAKPEKDPEEANALSFHIPLIHVPAEDKKEASDETEQEAEGTVQENTDSVPEPEEDDESREKLSLMKPTKGVFRILVAGILILAVILVYALIQSRRVYSSYEVMSAVSNADDASASYQVNRNGMIRYSNNGIALTDKSSNVIWNQTYEMNNPIVVAAGNYIAAGDRGASTLFIFNQYGQSGKLTTDLPLQGMQIADNGVVAAILSDAESNYINLYDKQGNRLVSIRATLENTGYPLAIGLSPDASRLVVSYLCVESANVQTKVVFYDFSTASGEHEKLSGTMDELCPKIQFLGDQRVAVFREKGFDIFSAEGDIKKVASVEFDDTIRSVFADDQRMGFLFRNNDENGKYRLELYDVSGQKSMTIYSDLDYTDLCADADEVVLFNNYNAEIYKFNGKQVFGGAFENRITALMPSWDTGMYWLVEDSQLSEIRVK